MKKILTSLFAAALTFTAVAANQFSSPSTITNSQTLVGAPLQTIQISVTVPAIALTITATNTATIITNTLARGLTVAGTQLTPDSVFVYNAGVHGLSFTTNWAAYSYVTNVYLIPTAVLQTTNNSTTTSQIQ